MSWIKAEYEFGSLFSYRIPDYPSPSYALSSPLPGPSTIKLAIVATAIETSGKVEFGEKIFGIVKNAEIKIRMPRKIALSNLLIKRLKKKKEKSKLETTFGIRGYVHLFEPLSIYLNIDDKNGIKNLLKKIRRFGTSDSLVYCKSIVEEEPPANCIEPVETLEKAQRNVLLVPVKDLSTIPPEEEKNIGDWRNKKCSGRNCEVKPEESKLYKQKKKWYCEKHLPPKFEEVNPYIKSSRGKNVFVNKFYLLPISKQIQGKNWIIYETS